MPSWIFVLALTAAAILIAVGSGRQRWPALRIEPFPAPWRRILGLALLAVVLALVVFVPLLAFPWVSPTREDPGIAFGELFLGHAVLVAFLLAWWVLAGRPDIARFLALDLANLEDDARLGAATAAAGWAAMAIALLGLQALAPEAFPRLAGDAPLPDAVRAIAALGPVERFLLAVSAGVVEECFFRSFLQVRAGAVLSVAAFAASHMTYGSPLMLAGVVPVGMVFAAVFARRTSLLPCVVGHILFDVVQLFLFLPSASSER